MKIVFDLDGTLADVSHRRKLCDDTGQSWWAVENRCGDDTPVWPLINLFHQLHDDPHVTVEIWSGRSASVRPQTLEWFLKYTGLDVDSFLFMRPEGDYQPDEELKEGYIAKYGRPDLVFDDRQKVVDRWRALGITCAQVAPGDFDKPKGYSYDGHSSQVLIMVGPSGAGKTTMINKLIEFHGLDAQCVLSSDGLRQHLCGDFQSQEKNTQVFACMHELLAARTRMGLRTIVDATNVRSADRKAMVKAVPPNTSITYMVVDRPLAEKHETAGWRADVVVKGGMKLIDYHHNIFQSNLKDILNGDGFANVTVNDARR